MYYFRDYIDEVVSFYHNKAASGSLSTRLVRLTPANLKKECVAVCTERFNKGDERVLRDFFGLNSDKEGYIKAIYKCDIDKFRPLINYINKKGLNTADVNIELLAWLIDFKPRPFQRERKNRPHTEDQMESQISGNQGKEEVEIMGSGIKDRPVELNSVEVAPSRTTALRTKTIIITILITLILGFAGYMMWESKQYSPYSKGAEPCMYWAGDHYEKGACIQRGGDSVLAPFDASRYRNFRRITDSSQITENSIGKVWYRQKDWKFEFYTMEGKHPVDGRNLRRLTATSYRNYQESLRK